MNTDSTAAGVTFFAAIHLLLWSVIVASGLYLAHAIYHKYHKQQFIRRADGQPLVPRLALINSHLWVGLIIWLTAFVAVLFYSSLETAYRPKTVIKSVNPQLQRQLQALDNAPSPVIAPSIPSYDMEQALQRNRQENQRARETFQ
ncbi:hypothetical protein TI03_04590 [Achromatium sp. WMS1]|nr:hypothetical protein TI03_04590 [Achromatium sp. WMS1]